MSQYDDVKNPVIELRMEFARGLLRDLVGPSKISNAGLNLPAAAYCTLAQGV